MLSSLQVLAHEPPLELRERYRTRVLTNALKCGIDFDTFGHGKVYSCATAFNFVSSPTGWRRHRIMRLKISHLFQRLVGAKIYLTDSDEVKRISVDHGFMVACQIWCWSVKGGCRSRCIIAKLVKIAGFGLFGQRYLPKRVKFGTMYLGSTLQSLVTNLALIEEAGPLNFGKNGSFGRLYAVCRSACSQHIQIKLKFDMEA